MSRLARYHTRYSYVYVAHSQTGPHIATATQPQIFYDLHYDLVSYLLPAKRWESVNGNGNGRKRIVKNGALHCIATVATVKG